MSRVLTRALAWGEPTALARIRLDWCVATSLSLKGVRGLPSPERPPRRSSSKRLIIYRVIVLLGRTPRVGLCLCLTSLSNRTRLLVGNQSGFDFVNNRSFVRAIPEGVLACSSTKGLTTEVALLVIMAVLKVILVHSCLDTETPGPIRDTPRRLILTNNPVCFHQSIGCNSSRLHLFSIRKRHGQHPSGRVTRCLEILGVISANSQLGCSSVRRVHQLSQGFLVQVKDKSQKRNRIILSVAVFRLVC